MKITKIETEDKITFADIKTGEAFTFHDILYVKTSVTGCFSMAKLIHGSMGVRDEVARAEIMEIKYV